MEDYVKQIQYNNKIVNIVISANISCESFVINEVRMTEEETGEKIKLDGYLINQIDFFEKELTYGMEHN